MTSKIVPCEGQLLIAEPLMNDAYFSRSVILLTSCDEEGIVGHVLNRKSILQVKDLIDGFYTSNACFFEGGPVETDGLFFIHRCFDKLQSGKYIGQNMYWGGDIDLLKELIQNNEIFDHEIKFFLGYAGWDQIQLENELNSKSWIVTNQFHENLVFSNEDDSIWKRVIQNLGDKYAHFNNFPINPNLN